MLSTTPSTRVLAMTDEVRSLYTGIGREASPHGAASNTTCLPLDRHLPLSMVLGLVLSRRRSVAFRSERAQTEIRSLLANAQPDGFVAHVTFWQRERFEDLLSTYAIAYRTPYLSDCIQPPVLAEAVAAAARGPHAAAFLAEVLPRVRRYYDGWTECATPTGTD